MVGRATETADFIGVSLGCKGGLRQSEQRTSSRAVIITEMPIPRKTSQNRASRVCLPASVAPEATTSTSASVASESGRLVKCFMVRIRFLWKIYTEERRKGATVNKKL